MYKFTDSFTVWEPTPFSDSLSACRPLEFLYRNSWVDGLRCGVGPPQMTVLLESHGTNNLMHYLQQETYRPNHLYGFEGVSVEVTFPCENIGLHPKSTCMGIDDTHITPQAQQRLEYGSCEIPRQRIKHYLEFGSGHTFEGRSQEEIDYYMYNRYLDPHFQDESSYISEETRILEQSSSSVYVEKLDGAPKPHDRQKSLWLYQLRKKYVGEILEWRRQGIPYREIEPRLRAACGTENQILLDERAEHTTWSYIQSINVLSEQVKRGDKQQAYLVAGAGHFFDVQNGVISRERDGSLPTELPAKAPQSPVRQTLNRLASYNILLFDSGRSHKEMDKASPHQPKQPINR